ncbi:defensin-like protein 159 [Raphanus sativus]|uniref:Defensin-like protein 159 n=1 Tax=Raphanus sativus TaxID=3726 RepID=A0A6J0JJJ1_RAPSA|nr:defensin-like protein 159 [Raphanus sativus]
MARQGKSKQQIHKILILVVLILTIAKLLCSYFFMFMFVFSVFTVAQEPKGNLNKFCTMIIDKQNYCQSSDCGLACYSGYNGVGKCLKNSKAGGKLSCYCTYNC